MALIDDLAVRVNASEPILQQAIMDAESTILDLCNRTTVPPNMINIQLSIAYVYACRIKAAGEDSRSEGDVSVSYSYSKELPDDLTKRVISHRKLKQAGIANYGP
ncbi:MAG: hypothetical protein PHX08_01815 [Lachnospiraceae bacterium]|nr:hypothetical protein [Lachnospiraceae bacterium]